MDVSPTALLTNFIPRLPSILLICCLAFLGRTANSSNQDAVTQSIVAAARPILRTPAALARSQRTWSFIGQVAAYVFDILGKIGLEWVLGFDGIEVSQCLVQVMSTERKLEAQEDTSRADENVLTVQEAFELAYRMLRDIKHENSLSSLSSLADVEVEWTNPRRAKQSAPTYQDNDHREKEQFSPSSVGSPVQAPVILYFHGGAHCVMDPTTHRSTTNTLSQLSSADICSVRFRLSPQNPFPAALLDAFIVYLSLRSKPATPTSDPSHHNVPTSRIILAGDSSGAGLASSLLLLLLTLSKHNTTVIFNNQQIDISSPPCAGLALTSPWLDITRSLPSTSANCIWDIIAPPPIDSASPPFPADEIWPTNPPRAETYCTADICTHPLVSPLAAKPEHWTGAPPVWVCSGWEGFTDEIEVFARRIYQSGPDARVYFEGWEGMPHCFGMMPWNQAGWEAMRGWAEFCASAARGEIKRRDAAIWRATVGKVRGVTREVAMDELGCEKDGVGYVRKQD